MNNRIINSYVENFCGQNDFDSNKFLLFSTYQNCKKHNLDENMLIDCVVEGGEDVHHIFPKAFYKEQREIEEIEKEKTKKHILLFQ